MVEPVKGVRLASILSETARLLADVICPAECVFCRVLLERNDRMLCKSCRHQLVSNYHRCQRCAAPIPTVVPSQDCHRCRDANWKIDQVVTLGPYRDDLRDAVIRMKKPHEDLLRRALAQLMAHELTSQLREGSSDHHSLPILVPVPNYWDHQFLGAADTAGDLARELSRATSFSLETRMIRRIRKTSKQGMLSWTERIKNVRGAFELRASKFAHEKHVLVVDDVLTSGATCCEIARKLKRAGASRVTVVVPARGTGARETVTKAEPGNHPKVTSI